RTITSSQISPTPRATFTRPERIADALPGYAFRPTTTPQTKSSTRQTPSARRSAVLSVHSPAQPSTRTTTGTNVDSSKGHSDRATASVWRVLYAEPVWMRSPIIVDHTWARKNTDIVDRRVRATVSAEPCCSKNGTISAAAMIEPYTAAA